MSFKLPDELVFMQNKRATQKVSEASMKGKTCIITGATSGVGLEILKRISKGQGNSVIICRNRAKAETIKAELEFKYNVNIDIYIADFKNLNQVREITQEIDRKYKNIDVLINNVGIHSTTKEYTSDGIEQVFCINHLASFLITNILLDKMIKSSPSRIIQVNSEGHRFNGLNIKDVNWKKRLYTGLRGYGAAKTAQLLTVWEFADKLKGTGVTINAVHPGDVRTNIGSNNGKLYNWFLHNVTWHSLKESQISGEAIYYLASDESLWGTSGKFFNLTIEEKPAKHALNRERGKAIWDISMKMVGLNNKVE